MSRRYSETARLLEFALDMGQRVLGSVSEMLPEDARRHLNNAQREVIQALVIVYEQQAGTRRESRRGAPDDDDDVVVRRPRARARAGEPSRTVKPVKVTPATTRRPRSTKIDVK